MSNCQSAVRVVASSFVVVVAARGRSSAHPARLRRRARHLAERDRSRFHAVVAQ
jgi:hypothetical protein